MEIAIDQHSQCSVFSIWLHRITIVGNYRVLGGLWPENARKKIDDTSDSGDSFVHLIAFFRSVPTKTPQSQLPMCY